MSPEERRAQILGVVGDLFERRPYPEIGVADVADAAGITEGLVYHYFESRTGLFAAAVQAACADLLQACLPDVTLSVPAQFEQGVVGYLDYVQAHRVSYLNLFRGPAAQEPAYQALIEQTRAAIVEHIITVLGVSERPVPVTRLSLRGYLGFVESAVLHWLGREDVPRATLERLIYTMIITALSAGLQAEADRPLTSQQLLRFEQAYRAHFGL